MPRKLSHMCGIVIMITLTTQVDDPMHMSFAIPHQVTAIHPSLMPNTSVHRIPIIALAI